MCVHCSQESCIMACIRNCACLICVYIVHKNHASWRMPDMGRLCSPNEDFGRWNKRWNADFSNDFSMIRGPNWVLTAWKVLLNSAFHLLFFLPKSSFVRVKFVRKIHEARKMHVCVFSQESCIKAHAWCVCALFTTCVLNTTVHMWKCSNVSIGMSSRRIEFGVIFAHGGSYALWRTKKSHFQASVESGIKNIDKDSR